MRQNNGNVNRQLGIAGLAALVVLSTAAPTRAIANEFRDANPAVSGEPPPTTPDPLANSAQPATERSYRFLADRSGKEVQLNVVDAVTNERLWSATLPHGLKPKGRIIYCEELPRLDEEELFHKTLAELKGEHKVNEDNLPAFHVRSCAQVVFFAGQLEVPNSNKHHLVGGSYSYGVAFDLANGRMVFESFSMRDIPVADDGQSLGAPTIGLVTWYDNYDFKAVRRIRTNTTPVTPEGLMFIHTEETRFDPLTGERLIAENTTSPKSGWYSLEQFQFDQNIAPGYFSIEPRDLEGYQPSNIGGSFDFSQSKMPGIGDFPGKGPH